MPPAENANIAQHLSAMAARQPDTPALKVPRGRTREGHIDYLTLSFAELAAEAAAWQAAFAARGVRRGDRTLVMVRPGLPLIAAVFALFGLGAVPVVIDPGLGLKSFLAGVERSRPRALVGIPLARLVSRVFRRAFASVEVRIAASGSPVARRAAGGAGAFDVAPCAADDLAAVLFTSGSTGAPKGVRYTHGMFSAQVRLIRDTYGIEPGERDLPMLPVFALFNPALGMTTVVPELDPARPASVDPDKIIQAIRQEKVTNSFGSPTLWRIIARRCAERNEVLPSLRRVLMAGAPVPPALFADVQKILPAGRAHSPYGATESLPLASITAREVLDETAAATAAGQGTCVGRPVAEIQIEIIAITDEPVTEISALPLGQIGEIVATGPVVTKEYDQLPAATALAKIRTGASGLWHRLGDVGYLDALGRLWFCGRKAERLTTPAGPLFTEQVEPAFAAQPEVRRAALVGLGPAGSQQPAIVIEPADPALTRDPAACARLARTLAERVRGHAYAAAIRRFYFHPSFPVDVRHNAKIHRLALARWAATARGLDLPALSA